jgi:hypothetical protein
MSIFKYVRIFTEGNQFPATIEYGPPIQRRYQAHGVVVMDLHPLRPLGLATRPSELGSVLSGRSPYQLVHVGLDIRGQHWFEAIQTPVFKYSVQQHVH